VTYKEMQEEVDRLYEVAKNRKLIDEVPSSSPADIAEEMERKSVIWSREMKEMMETDPNHKMELLDLDEERGKAEETRQLEEDHLPGDFKFHWQSNYDDYLFEEFKVEVLGKLKNKGLHEGDKEYERKISDLAIEKGTTKEEIEKAVEEQIRQTEEEFDPWLGKDSVLKKSLEELDLKAGKLKEWDPIEEANFVEGRMRQAAAKESVKGEPDKKAERKQTLPRDIEIDPKEILEHRKHIEKVIGDFREVSDAIHEEADQQLSGNAIKVEKYRDRRIQTKENTNDRETKEKSRYVDTRREKQRANPKKSK
jgi:hypothetical protein